MIQTFWDKLANFPPVMCRLLARTNTQGGGVRPLTNEEIATNWRLTDPTRQSSDVMSFSWKMSWDGVPLGQVRGFTEACGIFLEDRNNLRKHAVYIRRVPTWKYLQRSPLWKELFQPLASAYIAARTGNIIP